MVPFAHWSPLQDPEKCILELPDAAEKLVASPHHHQHIVWQFASQVQIPSLL